MSLQQTWATATGIEVRLIVNTPGRVDALTYKNQLPRVIVAIEDLLITISKEDQ